MISENIYLSSDFKAMDSSCGIDGITLMGNAALCLYKRLLTLEKVDSKTVIVCGKGNNGGDGYALACILTDNGYNACIYEIDTPKTYDANFYREKYISINGEFVKDIYTALREASTVIDCIFGFSFSGSLSGVYRYTVDAINLSDAFVLSADIPSGLVADIDTLTDCHIIADATCTFTAKKLALTSYPTKAACGEVYIEDIGIPKSIIERYSPYALGNGLDFKKALPLRKNNSHKGSFGTLSAVVGSRYMPGAAYLSCLAALHSGVGLVRLCSCEECLSAVSARLAEPILTPLTTADFILKQRTTALLIGCGCGRDYDVLIKELITSSTVPTVIDADGINCIAGDFDLYKAVKTNTVITPHEMEMARLLSCDIAYVKNNRVECAKSFAAEYGITTVLKGAATIVAAADGRLYINSTGNTGLSKGGSGDVLAGVIASLLAQGMTPFEASALAVFLHGRAADILSDEIGVYAMQPSMLPLEIGKLLAELI